jgi:hypothetical protein
MKYKALRTRRSDHTEFFDLTDLIDHRESDSDLRVTVTPMAYTDR